MRRSLLGHGSGVRAAGFPVPPEPARKKAHFEGQPRLLVDHRRKNDGFFERNGLDSLHLLHNNCMLWEDLALCGTRGWFYEEETGTEHDAKILRREVGRLETSLKAAEGKEKLVFLHYPPLYQYYRCPEIMDLLTGYGVRECFYGHIHGKGAHAAFIGESDGVKYRLVSGDYLDFFPYKVRG